MLYNINDNERINPERISSTKVLEALRIKPGPPKRGYHVEFTMMDDDKKLYSDVFSTSSIAHAFIDKMLTKSKQEK